MTKYRVNEAAWRRGLLASFDKVRQHKTPYKVVVGEFKITVLPDVFSPRYFTDSEWFAKQLAAIVGKASLLEVGCGTGIVSLYCAAAGATVTATDINPAASRNTSMNAAAYGLDISVHTGDMYEPIRSGETFDFIFWNHPFNDWDEKVEILLRAGIDPNYDGLRRYVREAKLHLAAGGALLLGTSDMARTPEIEKIAAENGYRLTLLESVDMPIEAGHEVWNTYLIYRFDQV